MHINGGKLVTYLEKFEICAIYVSLVHTNTLIIVTSRLPMIIARLLEDNTLDQPSVNQSIEEMGYWRNFLAAIPYKSHDGLGLGYVFMIK